jgi:hypothetical protein
MSGWRGARTLIRVVVGWLLVECVRGRCTASDAVGLQALLPAPPNPACALAVAWAVLPQLQPDHLCVAAALQNNGRAAVYNWQLVASSPLAAATIDGAVLVSPGSGGWLPGWVGGWGLQVTSRQPGAAAAA